MTQQELADRLRVNVRTLKRWELEENSISDENIERIAKVLGYNMTHK